MSLRLTAGTRIKMETTKISNTEIKLTFSNAGPTIGSLLQTELLKNENTKFAGYMCPHPLETKMIITLITHGKNPKEVMINAFNALIEKLDQLDNQLLEKLIDLT